MSTVPVSNVFSDVYITGNCTVKGTITTLGSGTQWTTVASGIYYNSGNVGIGLTNPNSILNVNVTGSAANIYNTTTGSSASLFIVNTADNRRAFVGMDGTGLFAFSAGALAMGTDNTPVIIAPSYSTGEKMRITTTGLVGIGTNNPGSTLTVSGAGSFGSGYQTYTAPTGGLIVQGNVGIGTSNPGLNALQVSGNVATSGFTSNATNTIFNFDTLTVPFVVASSSVGVGTTSPVTALDVYGVISTNGLPLPYCIASGTGTFGTNYATTPAHSGSYFWYDRTSPIVIPQGANITIEIWGQSGYNQQGIAIDPYNSSTSQFNIQNTSQSGVNQINATYYGTTSTSVATDNTTQNPPWTMFSMQQSTTIGYYNWQQTIKFFNPATPSGNNKIVQGTVMGSGTHSSGNTAQFQGMIGFYSSTIAYTVTGFRILLVTTSTTTFSSTYSYRVYVS